MKLIQRLKNRIEKTQERLVRQPVRRLVDKLMAPNPDGTHSTVYLYHRLITVYFKPYLGRAILAVLVTLPIGPLDGAIAMALKTFYDVMQGKTESAINIAFVPFIIVGFTLVQGLLNYGSTYLNAWLGGHVLNDLRRDLFKKLQSMDVAYFDRNTSGTVIHAYFRDPEALQANVLNNAKQMLTRVTGSLTLMAVLIHLSWQLSIVAITVLLCILYPSVKIRKVIKEIAHKTVAVSGDILSYYTETSAGARNIYGYNLQAFRQKKFENHHKEFFKVAIKSAQAQGWLTPSMHIIASFGIGIIIWQGSAMVLSKELEASSFVSFMVSMILLYNPIKNLGGSIMTTQMSMLAAGRIFTLLDHIPFVKDPENPKSLDGVHRGVEIRDLSFSYNPGTPIFTHLNLTLHKGEVLALVGPSGGGKSTIANLIPRFYDVDDGAILIDGIDIRELSLQSLRAHVAVVTQESFLFAGTIRENILLGDLTASEEALWDAVGKAYLAEFVNALPKGLDTEIGERGVMLSGGQRQRVAIARAILKNAPILVLDEATSALDNQSEAIVQKALDALMVDKTVLVIAHRLSTIRNANRIAVIEPGQPIEELGSHEELMAMNGTYAHLYQTQFRSQEEVAPPSKTTSYVSTPNTGHPPVSSLQEPALALRSSPTGKDTV